MKNMPKYLTNRMIRALEIAKNVWIKTELPRGCNSPESMAAAVAILAVKIFDHLADDDYDQEQS